MTNPRPLAVVTGACSGIGLELAKQFAENGFDLLITAEDDGLTVAATQLRGSGADVQAVQGDLRTYEGVELLHAAVVATGRPVSAAALNAGVVRGGAFLDIDLADEFEVIDLNITSTAHLARADMLDTKVGQGAKDDPAQVAKQGFAALVDGKDKLVAGSLRTKTQGPANTVLPDRLKAQAHRAMAEPGSGEKPGVCGLLHREVEAR